MTSTNANIVILTAIFFIILSFSKFFTAFESSSWQETTGVIIASSVGSNAVRSGPRLYSVDVKYAYKVNDTPYIGDSLSLDDPDSETEAYAQEQLQFYPAKTEVKVFYDPEQPTNSTLQISKSLFSHLFLAIFGGIMLLLGLKFRSK